MATSIFDYASLVWDGRLSGYAASKLFPLKPNVKDLTGDFLTVTRAGIPAAYLDKDGVYKFAPINTPRIEYNTDGTYRGLLVEPGATNLALRSQEFNDAYWVKGVGGVALAPVVTANNQTAPDGTSTADTVVFSLNGGTNTSDISQLEGGSFTYVSETRTQSVFARTTDGSTVAMSFVHPDGAVQRIIITPTYQRFALASTGSATNGTLRIRLRGGGENTATTASIALWNWQFETGSVATSPIVTTAGTASRVADSVTLASASSLIGQTQGTLYVEYERLNFSPSVAQRIFGVSDGSNTNRIQMFIATTGAQDLVVTASGSLQALIGTAGVISGINKGAVAYATNDIALYRNGVSTGTDTSAIIPACNRVNIGTSETGSGGTDSFLGWIRSVALFPTRLPNEILTSVTTL